MAKRNPAKTARNKKIESMKQQLRTLLPQVLADTGLPDERSLNATIGGKAAEFIDLHHEVILSPEQYVTVYLRGFKAAMTPDGTLFPNAHRRNYEMFKASKTAQRYFILFLKRSYLKHMDELSRVRPPLEESAIWIGQNRAEYGVFITPRFVNGQWENDRSEIRHFPSLYWTIGHALRAGMCVPGDPDRMMFRSADDYLTFFKNTLVRASGSVHERGIAQRYLDFVKAAPNPEQVPLLIPELRYGGLATKHQYRLDFCIIDPFTMRKIGFELSPWSSHGYLAKIGGLTQAQVNKMAQDNFEKEMKKHRDFFQERGIFALIYTDEMLADLDATFEQMKQFLSPVDQVVQLDFHLMEEFFA